MVRELGMVDHVVELGAVPYRLLHRVYSASDIYVTPAYAESFAHPLVEAMAAGLPVVASDLPVHREICGPAALWFDRFSAKELTKRVLNLANTPDLKQELCTRGRERALDFSWSKHVDEILQLAHSLARK
jgi:glycosyltransferase involved in cell wall biosynthesis